MSDFGGLQATTGRAIEILDRLDATIRRIGRFETDSLKRTRALERAALTCPSCGAITVCPLCGADPGAKGDRP